MEPSPVYRAEQCQPNYKLYWTLALFWREQSISSQSWLRDLKEKTETDGIRILEYRLHNDAVSQFLLSTVPQLSPSEIIRSVKGRLQYQIRNYIAKAFKGNYSIKSIGSTRENIVRAYLDDQLNHHQMADPAVQDRLADYQIDDSDIDLTSIRSSSHGQFVYNMHVVLVHSGRYHDCQPDHLQKSRDGIIAIARKKGHRLAKASLLTDHIHLMVGCDVKESPMAVVLGYMNNLAFVHHQKPLFPYSFYVGTFGEYDLGAVRQLFR